jgi:predicted TIM-barrel fold metal-dependent hydrolase
MIDGIFIFDNVIHAYDMSEANLRTDVIGSREAREHMLKRGMDGRLPVYSDSIDFKRSWSVDDMYDVVFVQAPTDMAMAQVVPIFDWYKDFFAPVHAQYAMAQRYPERVLFCGGVDPLLRGLDDALEQLEHQIVDLGARSIKLYNAHLPDSWRCDDESLAYPLYQRCLDLGVNTIQFHKGVPFGLQNVEALRPNDLQAPARDFPELNFIIHHLAMPYFDETVDIASRFPNVYLALSGNINHFIIAPRLVQEQLGRLLQVVGANKLLWGSEAALAGPPGPYLRAFMDLEIPEDLRSGYGYPNITRADKELILGLNFGRMMGVDVEAKKLELAPN